MTVQIDFSTLTNEQILKLIGFATSVLQSRLASAQPAPGAPSSDEAAPAKTEEGAAQQEPDGDDQDFCMYVKSLLRSGGLVRAAEKDRVAEIAEKFPAWVAAQGLPTGRSSSYWRNAERFASTPRASVRSTRRRS